MASLTLSSVTKGWTSVNLTSVGTVDWAAWNNSGPSNPAPDDWKSGGGATIGGAFANTSVSHNISAFLPLAGTASWTDGTNTGTSSTTEGQGHFVGVGSPPGLNVTFPADTTTRKARVYFAYYDCNATVTATLSDASAGPASDSSTLTGSNFTMNNGWCEIEYAAASAGQTLTVRISVGTDLSGGGETIIQAATRENSVTPSQAGGLRLLQPHSGVGSQQQYFYGG